MREVVADKDRAYEFYCRFFPHSRTEQQQGLCQIEDGEVIASVIYDEYNGTNIFMHVAAKPGRRWMTRWFLHEAFKYPFITMGVKRITGWVEADNKDAIRLDEHLGFRREAVLEGAGTVGQDVYLYVMFRDACRYA